MKVAVIGSREKTISNLEKFLPKETTEIVSGGARGIDSCAREYALKNKIKLVEFLPDYKTYGRVAPLKRNHLIVSYCDVVIAFWDGKSRGTEYTINLAKKMNKKVIVYII